MIFGARQRGRAAILLAGAVVPYQAAIKRPSLHVSGREKAELWHGPLNGPPSSYLRTAIADEHRSLIVTPAQSHGRPSYPVAIAQTSNYFVPRNAEVSSVKGSFRRECQDIKARMAGRRYPRWCSAIYGQGSFVLTGPRGRGMREGCQIAAVNGLCRMRSSQRSRVSPFDGTRRRVLPSESASLGPAVLD